jgi:hypothetical protein
VGLADPLEGSAIRDQLARLNSAPQVAGVNFGGVRRRQVYGRPLLLLSCDTQTLQWYARQGVRQIPLQMSMKDAADPIKIKASHHRP